MEKLINEIMSLDLATGIALITIVLAALSAISGAINAWVSSFLKSRWEKNLEEERWEREKNEESRKNLELNRKKNMIAFSECLGLLYQSYVAPEDKIYLEVAQFNKIMKKLPLVISKMIEIQQLSSEETANAIKKIQDELLQKITSVKREERILYVNKNCELMQIYYPPIHGDKVLKYIDEKGLFNSVQCAIKKLVDCWQRESDIDINL